MKYLALILLALCVCYASAEKDIVAEENQRGIFENMIKGVINTALKTIRSKIQGIDGTPVITDKSFLIKDFGELTINKLVLDGISKFENDVQNIVSIDGFIKFTADIVLTWPNTQPFTTEFDHNLVLEDASSSLSGLAGPGGFDLTIKNSSIILSVSLDNKFQITDSTINMSDDTEFGRFQLGKNNLVEKMNELIHDQDILDIVSVLASELINNLLSSKGKKDVDMVELMFAKAKMVDNDFIQSLVILAQRISDL